MKDFRPAKKLAREVSVGELVRIVREIQGLTGIESAWALRAPRCLLGRFVVSRRY